VTAPISNIAHTQRAAYCPPHKIRSGGGDFMGGAAGSRGKGGKGDRDARIL